MTELEKDCIERYFRERIAELIQYGDSYGEHSHEYADGKWAHVTWELTLTIEEEEEY